MRTLPPRTTIAVTVFAVALGGGLLALQARSDDGTKTRNAREGTTAEEDRSPTTSAIWKVGDTWTVNVRQDAGAITPEGNSSVATIPFRFAVTAAPTGSDGAWTVRVKQDGAEGPFADGWRLEYQQAAAGMRLVRVAVGKEPPLEVELASIVLGPQFPYELAYKAAPKDMTINAERLVNRASLPPKVVPGNSPGDPATPPATAPPLPGSNTAAGSPAPTAPRG